MQFGEWVQITRKERGFDIRTFAEKTGVDASTISRIEHLNTQATLYTAFRICESFGVSLAELVKALNGNNISFQESNGQKQEGRVATLNDVEGFIKAFHAREHDTRQRLVKDINKLTNEMQQRTRTRGRKSGLSLFMAEDIDKLLFSSPIYQFRLKYPAGMKSDAIIYIYEREGALTLPDIEVYIRKVRLKRMRSFEKIDAASLERVRLADVLLLDNDTGEHGRIAAMYWEVCKFHERFNPQRQKYEAESLFDRDDLQEERDEWEFKLASLYITIYRWHQHLWGSDAYMDIPW